MDIKLLIDYQRYLPDLAPTKDGYWRAPCPWCRDQLEVGLRNLETGEPTDWLCTGCGRGGTSEEFFSAVKDVNQAEESAPGDVELEQEFDESIPEDVDEKWERSMSQFGSIDRQGFEGLSQHEDENFPEIGEVRPKIGINQPEVSSILTQQKEIALFLTLDLSGRELQILLLLQYQRNGISAKEISKKLQIPQSNVHRYLAELEEKRLIYSEGRPKRYFKIDDARLMGRFRRRLQRQI